MARLYLIVEGQTEQEFADTVLKPHLADFGVYLENSARLPHGKKKGRGGGRKYLPTKNEILARLKQQRGADVFVSTMIDLYALPTKFPGFADAKRLSDPVQRVEHLEREFFADIGDPRFMPYIQLHEFEAYLFSDPTCFRLFYDQHEKQVAALQAIADAHPTPELIDDGANSAPSKRIIAELPGYKKAKPVVGPQVAELIGLAAIRTKCPHFAAWLSRLEQLGTPSPP